MRCVCVMCARLDRYEMIMRAASNHTYRPRCLYVNLKKTKKRKLTVAATKRCTEQETLSKTHTQSPKHVEYALEHDKGQIPKLKMVLLFNITPGSFKARQIFP